MIRDILDAVVTAVANVQPPGTSAVTADPANTGTGAIVFDASSVTLGTFNGVLQVLTGGTPGTARAQLSLDGGNNFDLPFTLPVPAPGYSVPLPPVSAWVPPPLSLLSPGPSGLVLNFSGSFNVGDAFYFSALPQVTFVMGEEELSAQDGMFPRVVFFPTEDEFGGTEDYAQGRDQRTQPRSLVTDVAHFETHCWGCDYDRTELLRDTVINGIHFAVQATKLVLRGHWESAKRLGKAGQLYVLNWSVKKPVLQLSQDTTVVQPPFTANITTRVTAQSQ